MRKPPSDHDEWLEENRDPEQAPNLIPKKPTERPLRTRPNGANTRFKALNDDIQEFG